MFRYCVYLAAWGILFPLEAGAAKKAVKDVRFRTYADRVLIYYTLEGKGEYEVSLRLSDDGGRTFSILPKSLSGAVGKGIKSGRNRQIISWDVLRDVPRLEGDDFVFEVVAIRNRNRRPLMVFLGLAAAGAIAMAATSGILDGPAMSEAGETAETEGEEDGTIILEIPDPEENR